MKKQTWLMLAFVWLLSMALMGSQFTQATARESKVLEFDSMEGLPPAYTGTQNPIRGINGGGLPWAIAGSSGELKSNGQLQISVHGLVFADGPNRGSNTIPNFRAIVSCLASDGSVVNVTTDLFPATIGPASEGGGNAEINATLELPQPCIAPLVFVTSPSGAWFATVGH